MGCCLTTTTSAATAATADDDVKTHSKTRDTSPPGSGEETVKEVLSETPVTFNKITPKNDVVQMTHGFFNLKNNSDGQNDVVQMAHGVFNLKNNSGGQNDVVQMADGVFNLKKSNSSGQNDVVQMALARGSFNLKKNSGGQNDVVEMTKNLIEENASEVSSEMYSYTGSLSAATTTTVGTGIGIDEDGEVTQRVNKPRPVKTVARRQSPVKAGVRPPSPARRPVVRSTDRNHQLTSRSVTTGQRSRNVVSSYVVGKEPGRRSRSPAVRGEARQLRRVNSSKQVSFKNSNNDVGVLPVAVPEPSPEIKELLDNPLVSLECFIFL